jgi:N-formylglutamate deformylase
MTPERSIPGVLTLCDAPADARIPLVFDSPHSGRQMPEGSGHIAPDWAIDSAADLFVHELFGAAPAHGAALLHALFPRTFVDTNRRFDDIDPALVDGDPGFPLRPTAKSERGMGMLRRRVLPDMPMYPGALPADRVRWRVEGYWRPYHDTLSGVLNARYADFGAVWHINCHSMKPVGTMMNEDAGAIRPDIVVSDYLGETAEPAFTAMVADAFARRGYSVQVNDPYRGDHLIRGYADPAASRHSVQIELNRALYLEEEPYRQSEGYGRLASDLTAIIEDIAAWVRDRVASTAGAAEPSDRPPMEPA